MGKICRVEGCNTTATTRGYCEMHYRRVLRTGSPGPPGPLWERGKCEVDGCEKEVDARSLCHGHYQRLLRHSALALDVPLRHNDLARLTVAAGFVSHAIGNEQSCSQQEKMQQWFLKYSLHSL